MNQDPLFRELPDSFDPPVQVVAPPESKRRRDFAWALTFATGLWLFGTLVAMWRIVPKFVEVFAEVKVPMPGWTEAVVAVSRAVVHWPVACVVLAVGVSVGAGFLKGPARKAASALLPIVIVLTIGWIAIGLFLPLIGSMESVGKGRR